MVDEHPLGVAGIRGVDGALERAILEGERRISGIEGEEVAIRVGAIGAQAGGCIVEVEVVAAIGRELGEVLAGVVVVIALVIHLEQPGHIAVLLFAGVVLGRVEQIAQRELLGREVAGRACASPCRERLHGVIYVLRIHRIEGHAARLRCYIAVVALPEERPCVVVDRLGVRAHRARGMRVQLRVAVIARGDIRARGSIVYGGIARCR